MPSRTVPTPPVIQTPPPTRPTADTGPNAVDPALLTARDRLHEIAVLLVQGLLRRQPVLPSE